MNESIDDRRVDRALQALKRVEVPPHLADRAVARALAAPPPRLFTRALADLFDLGPWAAGLSAAVALLMVVVAAAQPDVAATDGPALASAEDAWVNAVLPWSMTNLEENTP